MFSECGVYTVFETVSDIFNLLLDQFFLLFLYVEFLLTIESEGEVIDVFDEFLGNIFETFKTTSE